MYCAALKHFFFPISHWYQTGWTCHFGSVYYWCLSLLNTKLLALSVERKLSTSVRHGALLLQLWPHVHLILHPVFRHVSACWLLRPKFTEVNQMAACVYVCEGHSNTSSAFITVGRLAFNSIAMSFLLCGYLLEPDCCFFFFSKQPSIKSTLTHFHNASKSFSRRPCLYQMAPDSSPINVIDPFFKI